MKKRIIALLFIFITMTLVCSAANTAKLGCDDMTVTISDGTEIFD